MTHLQLRSVSRALLAAVAIGLAAAPAAAQIAAAMSGYNGAVMESAAREPATSTARFTIATFQSMPDGPG